MRLSIFRRSLTRLANFIVMASLVPAAAAQNAGTKLEEVVVTGTFIKRGTDAPLSSPIDTMNRDDMKMTPRSTMTDFIIESPLNSGSFNTQNQVDQSFSSSVGYNLRGLGPRSTLVLINGQRQVAGPLPNKQNFNTVDVTTLMPTIMMDRVEILKDGAAALYGSDAIAGVANHITRDDFEGFEMDVDWNRWEKGNKDDINLQGIWGAQFDRGGVVAGFQYQNRERLFVDDVVPPDVHEEYGSRSAYSNPSTYELTASGNRVPDPLCGTEAFDRAADAASEADLGGKQVSFLAAGGTLCQKLFSTGQGFNSDESRYKFMTRAFYDVTDSLSTHLEVGYNQVAIDRLGHPFPTGATQATDPDSFLVPAANPGNPFGEEARLAFGRFIFNGGTWMAPGSKEDSFLDHKVFRVNSGFEQMLFDDRASLSFDITYSRNNEDHYESDVIEEHASLALQGLGGHDCDPATGTPGQGDCMYWNPFANAIGASPGDPEYNSPEVLDFVSPPDSVARRAFADQLTMDLVFSTQLFEMPGGTAGLATGYQYRDTSWSIDRNQAFNNGDFVFRNAEADNSASRDVHAFFAEVAAPVWEGVDITAAARYEDFGAQDTIDPKVGVVYTPNDNLTLRGSWGTSFRMPDLNQTSSTSTGAFNLRTGETVQTRFVGNPDVAPEESENLNIGFDYRWDNLDFSMDFWDIKYTGIVGNEDPQVFFDQNPNDPRVIYSGTTPIEIIMPVTNLSSIKTNGLDLSLSYFHELGEWGSLEFRSQTTWLLKYDVKQDEDSATIDGVGLRFLDSNFAAPMPEVRGNYRLTWAFGENRAYRASARLRYVTHVHDRFLESESKDFIPVDLIFTAQLGNLLGNVGVPTTDNASATLRLGVNNVFDREPARYRNDILTFESRTNDPRGRSFAMGFTYSF